jgi:hypothetical protein
MVYATRQPTSFENLTINFTQLLSDEDTPQLLLDAVARTIAGYQPMPEYTTVFTDELAPVEWIVNKMVLSYVFSGQYQELK